jgi:predicted DNA-binding transcriptional regulator AlpA
MSDDLRLVSWKMLKERNWPYTRTHTWRKIRKHEFPEPHKYGTHRGARVMWVWKDVKPFFESTSKNPDA